MKNSKLKLLLIAGLVATLGLVFTGCQDTSTLEEQPEEQIEYEIALVTDDSLIMDGGHSEVTWNSIVEFGATNGISHKYYKATEATSTAYNEAIDIAVGKGAKVVIADGETLEDVIYEAQDKYKDVKFILINAEPVNEANGDIKVHMNTVAITFATEEAGFLAGYAAVSEGYDRLGFIGENTSLDIRNYGYGFIRGANRAARENGINVEMKYRYCGEDESRDSIYSSAKKWYEDGTELIFVGGYEAVTSVAKAAEAVDGKVIGSGTDRSQLSDRVITSAVVNIPMALNKALMDYKKGNFPGGQVLEYGAAQEGVSLELKNNKLTNSQLSKYEEVLDDIASGEIKIRTGQITSVDEINAPRVIIIK